MKQFIPREYQTLIRDYILDNKRCAIWSFMGSGKTAATLLALDILQAVYEAPALVIAPPLVAKDVWPGETEKWFELSHIKVSAVVGDASERVRALQRPANVYTINFENLPWLIEHLKENWPFKVVVVDESSKLRGFRGSFQRSKLGKFFLRTGGTKRAAALAKLAFSKIERFIELTGTPAPNGVKTLWGQGWFIDGGKRLGNSFDSFSKRWFTQSWNGFDIIPLPHAQKEIEGRLADCCLSLRAEDWFDVKKPIVTDVYVNLPPRARKHYDEMEKAMYTEVREHGIESFNAGSKTNRCSQIANGALYYDDKKNFEILHDEKIKALDNIIEEAMGMPVLVAYTYKHDLAVLKKAFPQGKALDDKRSTVTAWNKGQIPIMFLHPASAGHGNNFQEGGNIIVFYGVDWDYELYSQVIERIGPVRQLQSGFNRNVFIYHILARGTIDEAKRARLDSKCSVQDALLAAMAKRG